MRTLHRLLYACFFLSGITGLVYEVVWGKYLSLFIGTTGYAHTIVLGTFMGGLAVGNAIFGRLVDKKSTILTLYAILELGIGVFCLLFPLLFSGLTEAYFRLAGGDPGSTLNLTLKFLLSAGSILPATILMGGTLPVLSKFVIARMEELGSKVGRLYFINSLGAVFGCAIAGFWLIGTVGLELSMILSAALNILIGLLFLYVRRFERSTGDEAAELAGPPEEAPLQTWSQVQARWVLTFVGLSGVLSLVYELVWIRLLSLAMGSSTYSFSIMLMTFIIGITLGGLLVSRIMRKERDALALFAWAELGVFATLILMLPAYERLPYIFNVLAGLLNRTPDAFGFYLGLKVGIAFAVMALPTLFIGMTLPLASRVVVHRLKILGTGVGSVFSVNTLGNLIGASLGGLVLLPVLGLQRTFLLAILGSGLIGAGLLAVRGGSTLRRWAALPIVLTVFGAVLALLPDWDIVVLNAGLYRKASAVAPSFESFRRDTEVDEVLFVEDGPDGTVLVGRRTSIDQIFLRINGKSDASTGRDMGTQVLLAQVPMLLHEDAKRILVVGLGSGVTVGSALTHPVESVDVVEISESVVRGSRYFDSYSGAPLDDPRTHLSVSDARDFMRLRSDAAYDVIISEPSNPWIAGMGNVFSLEYFEEAKRHLNPGGLMAQWLQAYETDAEVIRIVCNTFGAAFPYVSVWHSTGSDTILLGSETPLTLDPAELSRRLALPRIRSDLNRPGTHTVVANALDFLSHQIIGEERFKEAFPGEGPLNRDLFPILEYKAAKAFFSAQNPELLFELDERVLPRGSTGLLADRFLGIRDLTDEEYASLLVSLRRRNTTQDQRLVKSLVQAYHLRATEHDPGNESLDRRARALQLILTLGDPAVFGRSAIWDERHRLATLSAPDLAQWRQEEGDILLAHTNVFGLLGLGRYDHAAEVTAKTHPELTDALADERTKLRSLLGSAR